MIDPDEELRQELTLLRAAMAKRLREKLEAGEVSTSWFESARKFLTDQGMALPRASAPKAPPVVLGLPFPTADDR